MKIKKKILAWVIMSAVVLNGCGVGQVFDEDGVSADQPMYQDGDTAYAFRTEGQKYQRYNGSDFEDFYIEGVNIGAGIPNSFPGELGVTEDDYYRWFEEIAAMHANTIRSYTVLMPDFYNALYRYNENHEDKLYLFQGCWYDEDVVTATGNAYDSYERVEKDLKDLVDIIHGRASIDKLSGHAYGVYTKDISQYVCGWILGIESDQDLVEGTNRANSELHSYDGKYLSCQDVQPYEVFWCEIGDYVLSYEDENYHMQRPVSYSNWATADVFHHPNEPLSKEDAISLTVEDLKPQESFPAGIFASYHVYPYYPNFMFSEEPYMSYKDENGEIDTYLPYLKQLVDYHSVPVVIAEFGLPTSRGVTHVNPITGWNQGGHTDEVQGNLLVAMFEDIRKAGCAGGMVFTWQDEWFKRTWNTELATDSDYRAYWNDVQTCEQHFGLLEFVSDELENVPVIDGKSDDWSDEDVIYSDKQTKLAMKSDSTYVYLMMESQGTDYSKVGNYIYFDINQNTGCNTYDGRKLSRDGDFVLEINGKENTRLMVEENSDPYMITMAAQDVGTVDLHGYEGDSYHREYLVIDRSLTYPETGVTVPAQLIETGLMRFGSTDEESENYNYLTDFAYDGDVIEFRIPWGLLGFAAPCIKEITTASGETAKVDGMYVGCVIGDEDKGANKYTWKDWTVAHYQERLRKSYYILQDYLENDK